MTESLERLVAEVDRRVVDHELGRRLGCALATATVLGKRPELLPPFAALGWRAIPNAVIERRTRFLYAVGWLPPRTGGSGLLGFQLLPPEATLEDVIAATLDAGRSALTDPSLVALFDGYTRPDAGDMARLDEFFDRVADAKFSAWRTRPRRNNELAPVWSRVEAATVGADRWFGRGRSGRFWSAAADAEWSVAELKRRRWG